MHGKDFNRAQRVGDQIQRELADVIARHVDDPRVGGVTLSGVEVSRDLGHARIFVTVPADVDPSSCLKALNGAAGYLRRRLAERLRMRYMPGLRFVHDTTLEQATRVSLLIDSVRPPEGGDSADEED
jgi:ribosome-binding factor A